jgi:ribonuclease HI
MKVIVHVDGGARGNPGPAAAACVISSPQGEPLAEDVQLLGPATNNVAEYRALLLGLRRARELGASEIEVIADSELVVRQVSGAYKVKHEAMRPLHREAMTALAAFESWSIRAVARAQNARADALVNAALDQAASSRSTEGGFEPPAPEPSRS